MSPAQDINVIREAPLLEEVASTANRHFKLLNLHSRLVTWVITMGREDGLFASKWRPSEGRAAYERYKTREKERQFSFQKHVLDRHQVEKGGVLSKSFNIKESLENPESELFQWLLRSHRVERDQAERFIDYLAESAASCSDRALDHGFWFHVEGRSFFDDSQLHFSWQGIFEARGRKSRQRTTEALGTAVDASSGPILAGVAANILRENERSALSESVDDPFQREKPPPRLLGFHRGHIPGTEVQRFAGKLPKADLHAHLGTSIGLDSIRAMALFSCANLLEEDADAPDVVSLPTWRRICLGVRLAARRERPEEERADQQLAAVEDLWFGGYLALGSWRSPVRPKFGVLDALIDSFTSSDRPIEDFEVCSILVGAIASLQMLEEGISPTGFAKDAWSRALVDEDDGPCRVKVESVKGQLKRVARTWRREIVKPTCPDSDLSWNDWIERAGQRAARAARVFSEILLRPIEVEIKAVFPGETWLLDRLKQGNERAVRLEDLVKVPANPSPDQGTLDRYLLGCDVLGSAHLQYPENLALASWDLVEQASTDHVIYTELRCAPIGYTKGGSDAKESLSLLCRCLDLFCIAKRKTWFTRFNLLVGAKRHKPHEFDETIYVLLKAREDDYRREVSGLDAWWKPCKVVGFDLSGREHLGSLAAADDQQLAGTIYREKMQPLFRDGLSITIHAGEAQRVQSIWEAVHMLGARRLGHGLSLGESKYLLEYCARFGIGIELCPTSNQFTNEFQASQSAELASGVGQLGGVKGVNQRYTYPLRKFMDSGLHVCLSTDNRQLHREGNLTGEYVKAAELCGGFSKWELILLAKAGVRNAFLGVEDRRGLLDEFAKRTWEFLATEPEFAWLGPNEDSEPTPDEERQGRP